MKKQLKTKLLLTKETVAKLNDEQMELVAGGQGISAEATVVISLGDDNDTDACGSNPKPSTPPGSKTCPPTATCCCTH